MTKRELMDKVAASAGVSKAECERVVNASIDTITEELKNGGSVNFIGFGKFEVRTRQSRNGVNPRTKKAIKIPAKKVAAFKAGKNLQEVI
ncbi:MAG: HU family DNA-binding protein [Campylobacterales bacterium]|nr:HU family DNA-binding protein [Campylobacterales bacterium]